MDQLKLSKILACSLLSTSILATSAAAKENYTNMARMQAMDKITGKVSEIDVPVNGEVKFGSFSIVVRACATRPPEETPENYAFVDIIDDYNANAKVNIFRGWMVSSSPALNAVEHPIYDVWLLKCYDGDLKGKHMLSEEELRTREDIAKESNISENKLPEDFKTPALAKTEAATEPAEEAKTNDGGPIQLLPNLPADEPKAENEVKEIGAVEMKGLIDAELPENKVISLDKAQNDAAKEDDNAPKMLINIDDNNLDDMVKNIESAVAEEPKTDNGAAVADDADKTGAEPIAEVSIVKSVDDKAQEKELQEKLEKAAEEEALRRQRAREAIEALGTEAKIGDEPKEEALAPLVDAPAADVAQPVDNAPIEIKEAPQINAVEPLINPQAETDVKEHFSDDDIIIEEIEEDGMIDEE